MADGILILDAIHERRMEEGSRALLHALRAAGPQRGKLVWHDKHRPENWRTRQDSLTTRYGERIMARLIARDKRADELRTYRDPCPLCNVRGDIGCGCRR